MRILTIVGIRKSGKTSTVTALIQEIRRRGLTVGTCKTVFCPGFSIDKPTSNTAKHRDAGAQLVCARAKGETALLTPRALPLSEILQSYQSMDYVLLEGDYLAPVPRLVAAHHAQDALPRTNDLTLCYVGRVSASEESLPLPRFNALTQPGELLDFIDAHVPEQTITPALDIALPPVEGVSDDGFCQCGCHHTQKQQTTQGVEVTVDGEKLTLTPAQAAQIRAWKEEKHG